MEQSSIQPTIKGNSADINDNISQTRERRIIINGRPVFEKMDPITLLDLNQRSAYITTSYAKGNTTLVSSGKASVQFPGCNTSRLYQYFINYTDQYFVCTGHSTGFKNPKYFWKINGQPVTYSVDYTTIETTTLVSNDDPSSGQMRTLVSKPVTLYCLVNDNLLLNYTLDIFCTTIGHIHLNIELDVYDASNLPDTFISIRDQVVMDNETITWEPDYYTQMASCRANLEKLISSVFPPFNWIQWAIAVYRSLPDPVPELFDLSNLLKQLQQKKSADEALGNLASAEISNEIIRLILQHFSPDTANAATVL
jgi:hypothetical protein